MPHGLFVTGTDTGVGKTAVSAALLSRFRRQRPVRYWKPIQTGIEQDDDTVAVAHLACARPEEIFDEGVRLPRPVSPHLAARWERQTIDLQALVASIGRQGDAVCWIVEGAGGALVPINDDHTMIDLMVMLDFPVVVVARTSVGTINHTLMTVEALRHRSRHVAGVVMVGNPDADARDAIEHYGHVAVVGEMPTFDALTPEALAAWASNFDPAGRLLARTP
jgi:dethiobiotin synthetase